MSLGETFEKVEFFVSPSMATISGFTLPSFANAVHRPRESQLFPERYSGGAIALAATADGRRAPRAITG